MLDRLSDESLSIAVPDSAAVVGVDDGKSAVARVLESRNERGLPLSKGREQALAVLMAEIVDDVYEEKYVVQRSIGSRTVARTNE
jgi:hypothetical protein